MVISRDALIPGKEGTEDAGVYVVREGKAHRVSVRTGGSQQEIVWVKQGLAPGDLVITEIGPSLKDGAAVRDALGAEAACHTLLTLAERSQ